MRITTYKNYIDEEQKCYLVKERSVNYPPLQRMNNPAAVHEIMCNVFHLDKLAVEQAYLICLNAQAVPTAFIFLSQGTCDTSLVHRREVFLQALLASAVKIILCHNHPSGEPEPSSQDILITNGIKKAGEMMQIPLLDHIIIGGSRYYSFQEQQLL